jgi:hypothetical protein
MSVWWYGLFGWGGRAGANRGRDLVCDAAAGTPRRAVPRGQPLAFHRCIQSGLCIQHNAVRRLYVAACRGLGRRQLSPYVSLSRSLCVCLLHARARAYPGTRRSLACGCRSCSTILRTRSAAWCWLLAKSTAGFVSRVPKRVAHAHGGARGWPQVRPHRSGGDRPSGALPVPRRPDCDGGGCRAQYACYKAGRAGQQRACAPRPRCRYHYHLQSHVVVHTRSPGHSPSARADRCRTDAVDAARLVLAAAAGRYRRVGCVCGAPGALVRVARRP